MRDSDHKETGDTRSFAQVVRARYAPCVMVPPRPGREWGREGFGSGRGGGGEGWGGRDDGRFGRHGFSWQRSQDWQQKPEHKVEGNAGVADQAKTSAEEGGEANWMDKSINKQSMEANTLEEKEELKLKQKSTTEEKVGSQGHSNIKGDSPSEPVQCFRCKEFGHHMKDCRKPWRCEKCGDGSPSLCYTG